MIFYVVWPVPCLVSVPGRNIWFQEFPTIESFGDEQVRFGCQESLDTWPEDFFAQVLGPYLARESYGDNDEILPFVSVDHNTRFAVKSVW
jgi:hypothetical protein